MEKHKAFKSNYLTTKNLDTRINIHDVFGINPTPWHHWVAKRLPLKSGARVLEIGCGTGELWNAARMELPKDIELILTDKSQAMLDATTIKLSDMKIGLTVQTLDANDIDFPTGSVDLIVANHMLYHVDNPSKTLSMIRDLLVPGGRAIFTTNGFSHMSSIDETVLTFSPNQTRNDLANIFGLETGYPLTKQFFDDVTVERYTDGLHITDSQALVNYVKSLPLRLEIDELSKIEEYWKSYINKFGAFFVAKDAGLIQGIKPA